MLFLDGQQPVIIPIFQCSAMKITREEVQHVAKLARLDLTVD
jgi:hypothetical protein